MLNNGGIMNGLDFKPGVKKRITDNEYAMKGASTAIGGAGGAIGNFGNAFFDLLFDSYDEAMDFGKREVKYKILRSGS